MLKNCNPKKKSIFFRFYIIGLFLFGTTSCGYRCGESDLTTRYSTISVPFVEGDPDGDLTAAVVEEIAKFGAFTYTPSQGNLILQIKVVDLSDENIGFRYDRKKRGKLRKSIVPVETRVSITAEVILIEVSSGKNILGPARLTAWVDFDHNYYTSPNAENVFSLGQLNNYDAACDAVYRPLNKALAQKVVDFITDSW
jgi:hypothetical protein